MPKFNGFRSSDIEKEKCFRGSSYHRMKLPEPFPPEKIFPNAVNMTTALLYLREMFPRIGETNIEIECYDKYGDIMTISGLAVYNRTDDIFEIHVR